MLKDRRGLKRPLSRARVGVERAVLIRVEGNDGADDIFYVCFNPLPPLQACGR